uniref:Uncharacterized protein n=1 Tax=Solanum tuberosum TaxID=4113 RepID=M1D868_SOLTU
MQGAADALGAAGAICVSLGLPLDLFVDALGVADPLGVAGAIGLSLGLYLSFFEEYSPSVCAFYKYS